MKNWFFTFILTLLILFLSFFIIDSLLDPFGIHSVEKQRVEDLTAEHAFLFPSKLANQSQLYILGTSRTLRFDIAEIQKLSGKKTTFLGLSGSDISQWNLLLNEIHKRGGSAIIGLDLFSLNAKYGKENNKSQILLQDAIKNKSLFFEKAYFLNPLYIQTLAKSSIKNLFSTRIQHFENLNSETYSTPIITKTYKNFTLWNNEVNKLIKQLKDTDYIVIFPEFFQYYCFYQQELLLDSYLKAISKIVLESEAKVWSFMDINELTTNRLNYDDNAWHFKPNIASTIAQAIFLQNNKYGILLTKENLKRKIEKIKIHISNACTETKKL